MPSQVWKCNYCNTTSNNFKVVEEHEQSCSFDPKQKKCLTCKHHDWFYDVEECHKNMTFEHREDVSDGKIICEFWEKG